MDVLRGAALLMIFVNHIPGNVLSNVTLQMFALNDAAELFVFLAGYSSWLAYGRHFERHGFRAGSGRVLRRAALLYGYQVVLLLLTLAIVLAWTRAFGMEARAVKPILDAPVLGLARGVTLTALPERLDILPLYVVLLASFPVAYALLRRNAALTVAASAAVWAVAGVAPWLNLPNWLGDTGYWYFNPFAWQFLFVLGAVLAGLTCAQNRPVFGNRWFVAGCAAVAIAGLIASAPWREWGWSSLQVLDLGDLDKTTLSPLRLANVLALVLLALSSDWFRRVAEERLLRPLALMGRHSLEVFALGSVLTVFGGLTVRTYGSDWVVQLGVNTIGIGLQIALAVWLSQRAPTR